MTPRRTRVMGPVWSIVGSKLAMPVYGTSPKVGFSPTSPADIAGSRIEPPWSPPMPRSASPRATITAVPLEDPPVLYPSPKTLSIRPVRERSLRFLAMRLDMIWPGGRTRDGGDGDAPERQIFAGGLADDRAARLEYPRDDRGVHLGRPILHDRRAQRTRHALDRDVVLAISTASLVPGAPSGRSSFPPTTHDSALYP